MMLGEGKEAVGLATWLVTVAGVTTPVVLAVVGWKVSHAIASSQLAREYLALATDILREGQRQGNEGLRRWAASIMREFSPVKLSDELQKDLAQRRAVLPGEGVLRLEAVPVQDPDTVHTTNMIIVTLTNLSGSIVRDVGVSLLFAGAETEFVSADGATDGNHVDKRIEFSPFPSLTPRQKISWTCVVKSKAIGNVIVLAEVNSFDGASPAHSISRIKTGCRYSVIAAGAGTL